MNFSLKKNSPENMAQPARAQLKNHHYKQKLEGSTEFSKYYLPIFEAGNTAVFPIVWSSKRNSMNRSHKKMHYLEWKYLSPPPCVHRLYSKQLPSAIRSLWFWHNLSVKTVIQNKYTGKICFKVKLWKENFPKLLVMDIKNTHLYGLLITKFVATILTGNWSVLLWKKKMLQIHVLIQKQLLTLLKLGDYALRHAYAPMGNFMHDALHFHGVWSASRRQLSI